MSKFQTFLKSFQTTQIFILLTFGVLLGFYYLNQTQAIWQNLYPQGDDAAFLATAESIRQEGGIVTLLPRMLTGDYKEANRHPLYVAILSTFSSPSLNFFVWVKIFNLFLGISYLLLLFFIMRRLLNDFLALLMVFCFAQSYFFVNQFAKVSSEPLLMIFVLLGWYLLTSMPKDMRRIKVAGVTTALAFLTKVTGIFLLGAEVLTWAVYALLDLGNKGIRGMPGMMRKDWGKMLIFLVTFILVSSPLLWRNILVYHNPFHNYNSQLLWIHSGEERRSVELYAGQSNNLKTYLEEQSLIGTSDRLLRGMLGESVVLTQMVFFEYGRFRGALMLFLLFAVSLLRDKNRRRAFFSLLLFLQFFLFFSWYFKISSHFRYVLPILFLLYFYLFMIIHDYWLRVKPSIAWSTRLVIPAQILLLLASTGIFAWETQQHDFVDPRRSAKVSAAYQNVASWVTSTIIPEDRYLNGPGHDFQIEWLTATAEQSLEMPYVQSLTELQSFLKDFNVDYVILSRPVVLSREEALGEYFDVSTEGVIVRQNPPGWDLVAQESDRQDPRYVIYKVKSEN